MKKCIHQFKSFNPVINNCKGLNMKNDKEKYDVIKTTRITKTQDNKLAKLGISVREAIDFAIAKHENPIEKLNERRQEIEKEIKEHENKIKKLRVELEEIIEETGVKVEIKENENINAVIDAQKLVDRGTKKGIDNLFDYIGNKDGKRHLKYLVDSNGGEDKEKYRKEVIKYAENIINNKNE